MCLFGVAEFIVNVCQGPVFRFRSLTYKYSLSSDFVVQSRIPVFACTLKLSYANAPFQMNFTHDLIQC